MENMTIQEAIRARHSVRKYTGEPITADLVKKLNELIDQCNRESGLHMQPLKAFISSLRLNITKKNHLHKCFIIEGGFRFTIR